MMFITILSTVFLIATVDAVRFTLQNFEGGPIWVGIQGNPGHPHPSNGGLVLAQGQVVAIDTPDNWAGRFWGRTYCNPANQHCDTGDCGNKLQCAGAGGVPPVTLAEITLKGSGGLDFYDISLVDGYNIQLSMEPVGGQGDGGQYSCKKTACAKNLLGNCPNELKVRNGQNIVVACNSACGAFNTDQYCCRGSHDKPETCKSTDWPVNYPKFFKDNCPDAYSYAYDDHKSTFTCKANHYRVNFGGR